jgi:hypothetical protein
MCEVQGSIPSTEKKVSAFLSKVESSLIKISSWALLTHTCNPSYLGGRDQEDQGSKAALDKYFTRPNLKKKKKKTHTKKWRGGLVGWLKV